MPRGKLYTKMILMKEKPFGLSIKIVLKDDNGRCLLLKRSMSSK